MRLKYFTLDEFDSPDLKGSGERMDEQFLIKLDAARHLAEIPFKINSGYRTPQRNRKVKGKANSSHLKGLACDIKCTDSKARFKIVESLILVGFNRIGISETFIHVDDDKMKVQEVIWTYG